MRISDWSSDVCSSDLTPSSSATITSPGSTCAPAQTTGTFTLPSVFLTVPCAKTALDQTGNCISVRSRTSRSGERRVGNACVSTSSSRWSPYTSHTNYASHTNTQVNNSQQTHKI